MVGVESAVAKIATPVGVAFLTLRPLSASSAGDRGTARRDYFASPVGVGESEDGRELTYGKH
jgi:hypothetical protein